MRSTIILLAIAAILMAVVVCVPIVAIAIVIAAATVIALRRAAVPCFVQPLALVVLVPFRAPPA